MKNVVYKFIRKCESICDFKTAELPKEYHYSSLVFCILDAVFSIGARYTTTEKVVERYANKYELTRYTFEKSDTEHTIKDFITNINSENDIYNFTVEILKNRQRTSTKNGILKAQACYDVANVFIKHGINTINDFRNLSCEQQVVLDKDILNIKGQSSGIMLKYLYMLAGSENICKPDRHIRRFVEPILGENSTDEEIQKLFIYACNEMKKDFPRITVRLLDNKIWDYQKSL